MGRGCVKTLGTFANREKRVKNPKRELNLRDFEVCNSAELIFSEVGFSFHTASVETGI
jgi:hypothetical protein